MIKSILLAIVFQSLSVAVHTFIINYSTPRQCGDVVISWTKPSRSAAQLQFPLTLHIVPFDSIAVSQLIHGWNASMASGSTVVDFTINLTAGTGFLLAVTDKKGKGVGRVSEVKNVKTSHDTSCLSTDTANPHGHFQTFTTPSPLHCPSLTVTWDGSVKTPRPTILGFSPGESPVNMDLPSSPLPIERSVSINGTFTSKSRVVVLFQDSDSSEPSRTSRFLTVGGMDHEGCSTFPSDLPNSVLSSPTDPGTLPPCDLQCSNKSGGRVVGGTLAGLFCLAILLSAIFVYRRRHRPTHQLPPDPEKVSSAEPAELPSSPSPPPPPPPPKSTISNASGTISCSVAPLSTKLDGPSENRQQQSQEQKNESAITTTPTSIASSPSLPLSLPTSPLTRRRSWTSRSLSTEEAVALELFREASIFHPSLSNEAGSASPTTHNEEGSAVSRPDSPTLPEPKFLHASANEVVAGAGIGLPSNPRTPRAPKPPKPAARSRSQRSQRSQRSERRVDYLKLDPASDFTVTAGEVRGSRRASSQASRMSRETS